MTKPIPPKYGRRAPKYIHPRLGPPGVRELPRGIVARPFQPPKKSLTALDIRFTHEGVYLPRYREKPFTPEEIARDRRILLPNQLAAIRYHGNVIESITEEAKRVDELYRQLAGAHHEIERKWKTMSENQRTTAKNYLSVLAGALGNPNKLDSYYKDDALKSITAAIKLLEQKRDTPALLKIWRACNDLIARKNQLTRQRVFLRRRHDELLKSVSIRRSRLEKYIRDTLTRLDTIRMLDVPPSVLEKMLEDMRYDYRSMKRKVEPELHEAAVFIGEAGKALKLGKKTGAIENMRKANRLVLKAYARQYLFNESMLNFTRKSSNAPLRKSIYTNQLSILADNVVFWFARARNRENMVWHLRLFGRAIERDLPAEAVEKVRESALAVRNGMPALAEEKLLAALRVAA